MANKQLKWGIIGTGYIASRMANNLQEYQIPIEAVVARNFDKTKKFAEKYEIKKIYQKIDDFFDDSKIDIVYIATPNNTHYQFIKKALSNMKNVLCEKPMVVNEKQFLEVAQLAKKNRLILEEAFTPFHMPINKKIKEVIRRGEIGEIQSIEANFCEPIDVSNTQDRLLNLALGGGNLLDIGCYPICFATQYLDLDNVKIDSHVEMSSTGVDISSKILLRNEDKKSAMLSSSFINFMNKKGIISGSKGCIEVDHFSRSDLIKIFYDDGNCKELKVGDSEQAWFYEAEDMQKYIKNGYDNGELELSHRVIQIMDKLRKDWKLKYPFE